MRPHRFQDAALEGKDVLHVPLERGRHADEAHGFGGGRAVEHDDVVALLAAELVDVHHGAQLFHAGEDGEFLGLDVADAGGAQHRDHVGGDFAPVPLDLLLNIDLVDGEVVVDGVGVAGLGVEEAGFQIEGVGQAMRRIDAHDQGAIAEPGELQTGGSGKTGFPDASFAAKEKDAHTLSYRPIGDGTAADMKYMFEWDNRYRVGIHSIDAQHQTLFAIAQDLYAAMSAGRGRSALARTLDRLAIYTSSHFAHEERLMQLHEYPGLAAHKAEHEALRARVKRFQYDFAHGRPPLVQMLQFLRGWLGAPHTDV